MACNRTGCENVMCDTYIGAVGGYICTSCQSEFNDIQGSRELGEEYIRSELSLFMETEKRHKMPAGSKMTVSDFFKEYTE